MTAKPYGREHALALLEPSSLADEWTVDERGLWPLERHKYLWYWGMRAEYEVMAWKPSVVFADDPDAPDLTNTPALPFPFDDRDLAAFMLAGQGIFVAAFYGEWESGPDADALARIDPGNNYARRAVTEAFEAYRVAVGRVGGLDVEDVNLDAWRRWIRAMAAELLRPATGLAESVAEPAPRVVPVVQVEANAVQEKTVAVSMDNHSETDGWLSTPQIATVFDGLHFTGELWRKRLSDAKWVSPAKRRAGEQGGAPSMWCPLALAKLIHARASDKMGLLIGLNRVFNHNKLLTSHRSEWEEHIQLWRED